MQTVSDVIRRKHPQFNTVSAESTMYDALHKMFCEHVDYLIVLDTNQKFVGVLTEHDVASKVFFADKPLQHMQVRDFISTSVAPLRQELLFQKEKIKQRVNEALGGNEIVEVVVQ